MVAPRCHRHVVARALEDDHALDGRRRRDRLVCGAFQRHRRPATPRLVLGDQHLTAHVLQAPRERIGREAAEDDRVRRTEPCAREHRDGRLRDHPQVDPHRRALADAQLLEPVRELGHLSQELGVGQLPAVALGLAFPVVGDRVAAPRFDVLVEAVPGHVELAAEVPLGVRRLPLVQLRERFEPCDPLASFARPELVEVLVVDPGLSVRLRRELGRRRVAPLLEEQVVDVLCRGHGSRS